MAGKKAQGELVSRADLATVYKIFGVTPDEEAEANARFNLEYPHGPMLPYLCQQQYLAWMGLRRGAGRMHAHAQGDLTQLGLGQRP